MKVSTFSYRVRELRKMHQFTYEDMSNMTIVPQEAWQRYELGLTPSYGTIEHIARCFRVSPLWLMGYDAEMQVQTDNPAIGRNWSEVEQELYTPEEIAESNLRVARIGELIKGTKEEEL